ncbi:cell division protein FtsQ [Saccharopolyspora erythraea NRRL 2338]|uniref:cell division protein FtsQ/DivIB n=1 Tax=Saccharopolyspora erythraea TaxID=1836 RepID=UPI0002E4D2C0|nr:FtsQ-type POTRA domain-containing protein [Saccharopolyspora erythraea]PFG98670.1 cell division protein FtsQ [Saccharopolyspora erythraea NRRL 2338]QRK88690.1 FtsQ-type POTRA domain-containing protein [Saccharopolyspora erythraea]
MTTRSRGRRPARPGVRRSTGGRPVRGGVAPPPWRRWLLPAVVAAATVVALVLYFTPLLGVREVRVEGNGALSEQEVLAAAGVELGKPMLQVDEEQIAERLRAVPKVAEAGVELAWPSAVRLRVTERVPVAYLVTGTGFQLVDAGGVTFDQVPQAPAGLPRLEARHAGPGDPAITAAMTVLTALPPAVRAEVTAVIAHNPRDLRLHLRGDREVEWGGVRETPRKAAILPPLLTRPGRVYDVTSPVLPTVAQ